MSEEIETTGPEYPRWLFKGGDPTAEHILVESAEEEKAATEYARPGKAGKSAKAK